MTSTEPLDPHGLSSVELRERQAAVAWRRLPEFIEHLAWPKEQIAAERETRLRALLQAAKERSPWHARRLEHVDCDRVTERDLEAIPPMTKDDLMANFEAALTDAKLTHDDVEAHLAAGNDGYLHGRYRVVASGGSSGRRGIFVYDWDGWITVFLTLARFRATAERAAGVEREGAVRASIAGSKAVHMSYALGQTFGSRTVAHLPATLPFGQIIAKLNELKPSSLIGYASMLSELAREGIDGRLGIRPRVIIPSSEPLLPEMRSAIERAWQASIFNLYATSEGATAGACPQGAGMHLAEDLCIFEAVDDAGRPVPAGRRAAKLLVTRLFNHVQPLIRYELTDEVTVLEAPCACGSSLRRIDDIQGRSDDVFVYEPRVVVHPQTFRAVLAQHPSIVDYQVRQTPRGADVTVTASDRIDPDSLCEALARALDGAGVTGPRVRVAIVDRLVREASGKLKRFSALEAM